jgi:hypothetical protein
MSRYTKANHRVLMQFVRRDVWYVTFLEPGLQTPLPKTLTFRNEGEIRIEALQRVKLRGLELPSVSWKRSRISCAGQSAIWRSEGDPILTETSG